MRRSIEQMETIVGSSPPIRQLRELIARAAPHDLPVLIQGPTGSGKELVAAELHRLSGRRGQIVSLNTAAVPEQLFEATLFGYERGAFTGASRDSKGYIEQANGGTLFLDEIGSISIYHQAKLLRVIETGHYRMLGSAVDRSSAFRIVAASNEDVNAMVAANRFREDLFFRLAGITILVPSLQQRADDIPLLAEHFLAKRNIATSIQFSPSAMEALQAHDWPGNIRELRHVIDRLTMLATGSRVTRQDVVHALSRGRGYSPTVADAQARRLRWLLDKHDGDTARVACDLGVHRATVYRHMHRLGIPVRQGSRGLPGMAC